MSDDTSFDALLTHLKESRSFDFTGYKRSSLTRRIDRRMAQIEVADYGDYLDFLQVHPDEFTALFNTILINVTGFFRDPEAWDYLQADVLPALLAAAGPQRPIRVWSAGCASGEEAYTIAIVLAELLGVDEFCRQVKIYATDVDVEALSQARQATYTEHAVAGVPPRLLAEYFDRRGDRYVFHRELRRCVIFGRNDLVQDAPIPRVDVLLCRNTLMYFNAETQSSVLSRLQFSLAEGGVLFLGKAEMLLSHTDLFMPVDLRRRVFRKVPRAQRSVDAGSLGLPVRAPVDAFSEIGRLRAEAFLASPVAQIVITTDGLVALTNKQAEALFGVSSRDVGRPFRDLDVSYRPVELRGYIEQAQIQRRGAQIDDVAYDRTAHETVRLEIQVNPIIDDDAQLLGMTLAFRDVTQAVELQDRLALANGQLESAYQALQSTNEELETTNEELQSTVEELETTNEELQSTNEELETINEELQSTNDELQATNEQLRDSSHQVDAANAFLEAVLGALRSAVAVVDGDLRVLVWNRHAEDLWGVRRAEAVGHHLLDLDIGLPTQALRPMIRRGLADGTESVRLRLDAVNRRGKPVSVQVVCTPLPDHTQSTSHGVVLVMETDEGATLPAAERPAGDATVGPPPA